MKYTFFHDSYVKGHRDEPLRPSPSMSVDFLPTTNQNGKHRIATAVMNENIKIWEFVDVTPSDTTTDDLSLSFQLLAELTPTSECKTVNIVRWSPDGLFLATGCSSGHVLIWRKQRNILQEERQLVNSETNEPIDSALQPSEVWKTFKTFKNHDIDIMDLSWSPPLLNHASTVTSLLTVVSFDNKISVVDVTSGETVQEMRGQQKHHKSPVQGVSWDPWGGFFATQSCDKTVRIYNCDQKLFSFQKPPTAVEDRTIFTCNNVLKKCEFSEAAFLPKEKCTEANIKRNFALFREESSRILYRRLDVSPDGSLLVVPAGQFPDIKTLQETAGKKLEFKDVIFTFSRNNWKTPKIVHQGLNFPSIGIRFSPVLYKKTKYNQDELPYWMMFASISKDRLIVYSTEHQRPLYVAHLMHQEFLTDISWSQCGKLLFVSSWDGYFSVYRFEQSEIPEGYSLEKYDLTCDSENSTCHSKMLENLKRAFTLKSQNLTQLFSSHKKEDQEPVKINVLSVKRKQQN